MDLFSRKIIIIEQLIFKNISQYLFTLKKMLNIHILFILI